jgi:hypothetical protein
MAEIAVVVSSCDRYRDLWKPFFTLFFRYWPDVSYPAYLITNHSEYSDSRVRTIAVGDDRDWSSTVERGLRAIPESFVILLLEDYFLRQPVDEDRLQRLLKYMARRKAAYLRLYPNPGPDTPCSDNSEVGEISKGAGYRASLQAAIWDRQVLLSLLKTGETAWDFELIGSKRTTHLDAPFLSVRGNPDTEAGPIPYFCHAIRKGKWVPGALQLCKREGIQINLDTRPAEGWRERLRYSQVVDGLIGAIATLSSVVPLLRPIRPLLREMLRRLEGRS